MQAGYNVFDTINNQPDRYRAAKHFVAVELAMLLFFKFAASNMKATTDWNPDAVEVFWVVIFLKCSHACYREFCETLDAIKMAEASQVSLPSVKKEKLEKPKKRVPKALSVLSRDEATAEIIKLAESMNTLVGREKSRAKEKCLGLILQARNQGVLVIANVLDYLLQAEHVQAIMLMLRYGWEDADRLDFSAAKFDRVLAVIYKVDFFDKGTISTIHRVYADYCYRYPANNMLDLAANDYYALLLTSDFDLTKLSAVYLEEVFAGVTNERHRQRLFMKHRPLNDVITELAALSDDKKTLWLDGIVNVTPLEGFAENQNVIKFSDFLISRNKKLMKSLFRTRLLESGDYTGFVKSAIVFAELAANDSPDPVCKNIVSLIQLIILNSAKNNSLAFEHLVRGLSQELKIQFDHHYSSALGVALTDVRVSTEADIFVNRCVISVFNNGYSYFCGKCVDVYQVALAVISTKAHQLDTQSQSKVEPVEVGRKAKQKKKPKKKKPIKIIVPEKEEAAPAESIAIFPETLGNDSRPWFIVGPHGKKMIPRAESAQTSSDSESSSTEHSESLQQELEAARKEVAQLRRTLEVNKVKSASLVGGFLDKLCGGSRPVIPTDVRSKILRVEGPSH